MSLSKKTKFSAIFAGGAGVVLMFGMALGGSATSGADYNAKVPVGVSATTGDFKVSLTGPNSTDAAPLNYPLMKPGEMQAKTITVSNDGDYKGDLRLGQPFDVKTLNVSGVNLAHLLVSIDGYLPATPVNSPAVMNGIDLGSLNPGQARTYTVRVGLASAAGNEWLNKGLSGKATFTLRQS